MSPRSIITGEDINYEQHCKLEFGEYVQTHEESDNSMASRTTGAISLRPTGNKQGGYFFFSLSTGRRLNRNNWTNLPIPNEVIDRVNMMAEERNAEEELTFEYRDGRPAGVAVKDDDLSDEDETYFDEDYRSDIDEEYENEEYDWEEQYNRHRGNRITGVDENDDEEVPDRAESEVSNDETIVECEDEIQEEQNEVIEIDDTVEEQEEDIEEEMDSCLLYTYPSPRDLSTSRMPSSA